MEEGREGEEEGATTGEEGLKLTGAGKLEGRPDGSELKSPPCEELRLLTPGRELEGKLL